MELIISSPFKLTHLQHEHSQPQKTEQRKIDRLEISS
jgi:hypothetical protein